MRRVKALRGPAWINILKFSKKCPKIAENGRKCPQNDQQRPKKTPKKGQKTPPTRHLSVAGGGVVQREDGHAELQLGARAAGGGGDVRAELLQRRLDVAPLQQLRQLRHAGDLLEPRAEVAIR
eukprot:1194850-Prorocentrum_minimum.AAC.4